MISTLSILIALIIFEGKHELDIRAYLDKQLTNYNRIDYFLESPKDIDLSSCRIDDTRMFKLSGNMAYVPIKLLKNKKIKNSLITLRLELYKNVLVSNRSIARKEPLNLNNFKMVEKEVAALRFEPITVSLPVEHFRSKFNIQENSILQENMLEKIPEIEIGDRIEALFTNNSVSVNFIVTARSEGITGSIIKVKRDDKKIFKARVINNTMVKIIE